MAGQLKLFNSEWAKLTSDVKLLETVSGYKIEWNIRSPFQTEPPRQCFMNKTEEQAIDTEIERLLEKFIIVKSTHEEGEFLSTIFTRPKRSGGHRMILNLSKLNEFVEYHHFKMDTLEVAIKLIEPHCFMASIDLKDAYYSVPIHVDHQKYLKFVWKGILYKFTVLPNGLSSGPRLFTKLLKAPFSQLRKLGHVVTGYIDDTLILAQSKEQAQAAVRDTVTLLSELGFVIHQEKSVFKPVKEITYLGCVLNSEIMSSVITADRQDEILRLGTKLLQNNPPPIQMVATFVGKVIAAFPGAEYGKLHYRDLKRCKSHTLTCNRGNYRANMLLPEEAKMEIQWWISNIKQ